MPRSLLPTGLRTRFATALSIVALAATGIATAGLVAATSSSAAVCSDVDVSFARGTGEPAGPGSVGRPFTTSLTSALSGYSVSTYSVAYAANVAQTSAGAGATDLTNHITSVAAACPNTRFVIGGYSQGGTVVDIAVGIRTQTGGSGTAIPAALAGRVVAVVAFGNPLGLQGGATIASSSTTYGPRSRDFCNSSDSVCGSQPKTGTGGHTSYASNGATTTAASFAAAQVRAGGTPTTAPTTPPTTPPTTTSPTTPPTTTPPTTTAPATCVRASTSAHVDAGRATTLFGRAYAVGSRDSLGYTSRFVTVSLRQTSPTSWSLVSSC